MGHQNAVTSLSFQPLSGRRFVTGSVDCTMRVWSVRDGTCQAVLGERSSDKIWCCAIDASGTVVCSGGNEGVIRVWSVSNGEVTHKLIGHKGAVRCISFSPGCPGVLASGEGNLTWGSDNSIRVWVLGDNEGACKTVLLGHKKMATGLAWSPDGSMLATTSRDGTCKLWKVEMKGPGASYFAPPPLPPPSWGVDGGQHFQVDGDGSNNSRSGVRFEEPGGGHVPPEGARGDDPVRNGDHVIEQNGGMMGSKGIDVGRSIAGGIRVVTAKVAKKVAIPSVDSLWKVGSMFCLLCFSCLLSFFDAS